MHNTQRAKPIIGMMVTINSKGERTIYYTSYYPSIRDKPTNYLLSNKLAICPQGRPNDPKKGGYHHSTKDKSGYPKTKIKTLDKTANKTSRNKRQKTPDDPNARVCVCTVYEPTHVSAVQ